MRTMRWILPFLTLFVFMFAANASFAQQSAVDIIPAGPASVHLDMPDTSQSTHDDIYLTPDRSELVRLDQEAASIIVGNPQHLSVLTENSKTLVLVPQMPGATYITILDKNSKLIMQRHVIVAAPKDKYVRVRRVCAASEDKGCRASQVYYCPGACHEIGTVTEKQEQAAGGQPAQAQPTAGGSAGYAPSEGGE